MRTYKRYGKNITSVKYDFKKEHPETVIIKIYVDKTPTGGGGLEISQKQYLITAKVLSRYSKITIYKTQSKKTKRY